MSDEKAFTGPPMHPDDKRALKRFMTGQIQNILANEYGVGGSKRLKSIVEDAVRAEVARRTKFMEEPAFLERMAGALVTGYRTGKNREDAAKLMAQIAREEMKLAIKEVVGEAASRLHITLSIEAPPPAPDEPPKPDNFARF
ncbi:hypothetical protein [Ancylobacter rudongensis]|uniref:Uncharacterized protein n=1 Tax=Ancylobacter rudongensis TaxID=177413 RepID=A0A1G4UQJ7_9HYPH|nr:hypothetical protein [Ancylobacter rudongensis]SCW95902.1 hypothetical protein SAMN05660859_0143 [Ancylobacter rudongensis]